MKRWGFLCLKVLLSCGVAGTLYLRSHYGLSAASFGAGTNRRQKICGLVGRDLLWETYRSGSQPRAREFISQDTAHKISLCLVVCHSACQSISFPVCRLIRLLVCLSVYLYAILSVCYSVCVSILSVYVSVCRGMLLLLPVGLAQNCSAQKALFS